LSVLLEIVFSAALAPIRMLFHAQFVVTALTGLGAAWKSPPREDAETTWGEALRRHGAHTVLGTAWALGVYWLDASYAWWLLVPVVGPLALSIPISVYSSRVSLGRALRRGGLMLTPEEADPPAELQAVRTYGVSTPQLPDFVDAIVNPRVNAVACAIAGRAKHAPRVHARRQRLISTAAMEGWRALPERDRLFLLTDSVALSELHFEVWTSPVAHPTWLAACLPGQRPDYGELRQVS
jgi:membrane glycosyltransferase